MSKRKNNFYAVKKGRTTGIYRTWEECRRSVDGYSGAEYKGFATEWEAEEYMGGIKQPDSDNEEARTEEHLLFFAVRKGNTVGIFRTLDECWQAIDGYDGAEAKQFTDKDEAERYLAMKVEEDVSGKDAYMDDDLWDKEEWEKEEEYYLNHPEEDDCEFLFND